MPLRVAESGLSEGHREVATNWYCAGADGSFFWNLGAAIEYKTGKELVAIRDRYDGTLSELGDPGPMRYKVKFFAVDDPVLSYYRHISSTSPLSVELENGQLRQVQFTVGDNVSSAEKDG